MLHQDSEPPQSGSPYAMYFLARLEPGRPTQARRGRTGIWPAAKGASNQASSVLVSFPTLLSLRTDSQVCPARCSQSCPQLFGMLLPVKAPVLPTRHVCCLRSWSFRLRHDVVYTTTPSNATWQLGFKLRHHPRPSGPRKRGSQNRVKLVLCNRGVSA